jgi:hypothetical protein
MSNNTSNPGPGRNRNPYRGPAAFDSYTSPEAIAHAAETDELRELLINEYGITPEKIAPTGDGRGHVRLNFEQLRKLIFEDEEG